MSTISKSSTSTSKPSAPVKKAAKPSSVAKPSSAKKPASASGPKDSAKVGKEGKPNKDVSALTAGFGKNFAPVSSISVNKGDTLNGIANSQLKQAGFEQPSASQVKKAAGDIASVNKLKNPNNIEAGKQLKEPLSQTEGRVFNQLSQFPSGKADSKSWTGTVEGAGGLGDIARSRQAGGGTAAVDGLSSDFNNHMKDIGKPNVSFDVVNKSKVDPNINDFEVTDSVANRRFISSFNADPASANR